MDTKLVSLFIGLILLLCSCSNDYMRGSIPNHLQNDEGIFIHSVQGNSFSGNNPAIMLKIANDAPFTQTARIKCVFKYAIGPEQESFITMKLRSREWKRARVTGRKSSWGVKVDCNVRR